MKTYKECESCGEYHLESFFGDCKDNENRFTLDDISKEPEFIIFLNKNTPRGKSEKWIVINGKKCGIINLSKHEKQARP